MADLLWRNRDYVKSALSLEGFLIAEDATRNLEIVIPIDSPEGFFSGPTRLVKLNWRQLWPGRSTGLGPFRQGRTAR